MGADALRDGLREYVHAHQFGNASWPDLIALLAARTEADLATWSHAWVDEPGRPIVRTELAVANGRISHLAFTTRDPYPRRGLTWTEDLQVALGYEDRVQLVSARLEGLRTDVVAARGLPAPLFVLANGAGIGYGEFHLDAQSLAWLSRHLPEIGDALTRGSAWVTLWDSLLDGELPSSRFLDLAVSALRAAGGHEDPRRSAASGLKDCALARLGDPGLSPEAVAQACYVSVRQLHRLFAREAVQR